MFNPDLTEVLEKYESRYSLVAATAKRAREIAAEAEEDGVILDEKPVSLALDEIIAGKINIIESDEIK